MNNTPPLTHRRTLALALPIMAANISTPLVGLVDTGVVGQLPDPAYIGAVALGSMIFIFVFWAFGFLRMGTTGLTAQALGASDAEEIAAGLARALVVALTVGTTLIVLQWPIRETATVFLDAPLRVEQLARNYFDIRIWAAPATLANYAILGWFVGLGRTRTVLFLQLLLNVTNIVLDALFVLVFDWDVRGVAAGTVAAECLAAVVGLMIAWRRISESGVRPSSAGVMVATRMRKMLAVNRDIMIRSLALIFVFVWFISEGARQGEVVFAANTVLIHFVASGAYFLDGLAHTAETLVGRASGAADRAGVLAAIRLTTLWAVICAALIALVLNFAGTLFIGVMTVDPSTRAAAAGFLPWVVAAPLLGVWAYQLDGIFIGATRTAEMRHAMLFSLAVFIPAWWLLRPFGNHGLWAALSVHYVARAVTLGYFFPRLIRGVT